VRTNGVGPVFDPQPPRVRITPDGQHVLFAASDGSELSALCSYGPCVNNTDPNGVNFELYLYNLGDSTVRCVSCNSTGTPPSTPALDTILEQKGGATTTTHVNHALSQNGNRVFFHTDESLLPEDTNGASDVYEWETNNTGSCTNPNGCLSLISTGRDSEPSYFMDATPNGDDTFFTTSQRLVGWDNDTNVDLYDAREPHPGHPAGFPDPTPTTTCTNDSCRTTLLTPGLGALLPTGSATTHSHGNLTTTHHTTHKPRRPHCRHGYHLRRIHHHLRCIRIHHKKPRHHT
jgi:hypothetical protein